MKTPKILFYLMTITLCSQVLNSQSIKPTMDASKAQGGGTKSELQITPLKGTIGIQTMETEWAPVLTHILPYHSTPKNEDIIQLKAQKTIDKFSNINPSPQSTEDVMQGIVPTIGSNFIGNSGTGCPLDNTVAISNGGKIISLVNSNIAYYNTSGTLLYTSDIFSWYGSGSLVNNICDPKVIYDSGDDRFIFFTQTCDGISANSKVIIAFSTSNDPQGGWFYYELTGNPLNDGSWFDYPKIGVSNNELYVTGNLYYQGGGYNQSVIYQIKKSEGYAGGSLQWQYWSGIAGSPFTLCPLSNGQQGNYGPGVYLASVEIPGSTSSTLHFYDLTDDLTSPSEQLNHYTITTPAYSVAGNASQSGGGNLDNGDTRTQSGFYLNGNAHVVFASDIGSGWNGINYNRINVGTLTNTNSTFGLVGSYDYCYPAVASCGVNSNDQSAMIVFERSGSSIFPETRVVSIDDGYNWSASTLVKAGNQPVTVCGNPNRWGDYTGIARKYNSTTPTVWVSGAYGSSGNYWDTWIAEVVGVGVGVEENSDVSSLNLYPNPVIDNFKTEFTLERTEKINIRIIDIQGKVVKDLYTGVATQGENIFTFNKGNLVDGAYFLQILTIENQTIKNEKFIVSH